MQVLGQGFQDALEPQSDDYADILKVLQCLVFSNLRSKLLTDDVIKNVCEAGASPAGGIAPPRFLFLPPDLFLALPRYFFLKVSIALTVNIVVILTVPSPIRTSILFD